jgi:hypothetical protein
VPAKGFGVNNESSISKAQNAARQSRVATALLSLTTLKRRKRRAPVATALLAPCRSRNGARTLVRFAVGRHGWKGDKFQHKPSEESEMRPWLSELQFWDLTIVGEGNKMQAP